MKKELEEAAHFKDDVQRLEKQVVTLRSANSALKAAAASSGAAPPGESSDESSLAQPQTMVADGSAKQDKPVSDATIALLQKNVQRQAMELNSLAKALAEKEHLLADFRRHGTGSGALQGNAKEHERIVVCPAPYTRDARASAAAEIRCLNL